MIQANPPYKVALESSEMEYLVSKKKEDIAGLMKTLKFLIVLIIVVTVVAAIGMFIIIKISPETFIDRNEPPPNILVTCLKLMLLLLGVVAIATYYSYSHTLRKVIKDIGSGEKTIEPCEVIRKFYAKEINTYHVYITSVIRLSVEVTKSEYAKLNEGDKINLEYSSCSKIFFGYSIPGNVHKIKGARLRVPVY